MHFEIQLFGALREAEPGGRLALDAEVADIAALRRAVDLHAGGAWTAPMRALLARSAFASESCVLRDTDGIPADGRLALLPPVSGG
jgi:molybdopterin synthase sulfur carrier subunit